MDLDFAAPIDRETEYFLNDFTTLINHLSVIFGEDVAFGGVFRCTVGLADKYGKSMCGVYIQLCIMFCEHQENFN